MNLTITRLTVLLAVLWVLGSLVKPATAAPTVSEVAAHLICDCPDCGGQTLDQCPTCAKGQSYRDEIAGMLAQGRSQQQIIDAFADKYGEHMLASPRNKGIGAAAVIVPFLLLAIGLIPVVGALRQRHAQPAQPTQRQSQSIENNSDDPQLSAALRDFDF